MDVVFQPEAEHLLEICAYNLAFFFGPGLPRGFGNPSGPSAGPAALLTPFFLTISVGGGIDEGPGVEAATGVLVVESGTLSPVGLVVVATGCG